MLIAMHESKSRPKRSAAGRGYVEDEWIVFKIAPPLALQHAAWRLSWDGSFFTIKSRLLKFSSEHSKFVQVASAQTAPPHPELIGRQSLPPGVDIKLCLFQTTYVVV